MGRITPLLWFNDNAAEAGRTSIERRRALARGPDRHHHHRMVPEKIGEILKHPKAMAARMSMVKFDLATLEAAARE